MQISSLMQSRTFGGRSKSPSALDGVWLKVRAIVTTLQDVEGQGHSIVCPKDGDWGK